jgi:transcriptional regulator with XRE-family HTH domain
MNVGKVGTFIREQRLGARLSLRNLSGLAGVSIPYLSQVERGLRKPSADILQAIAKALRISAETLYVQAGMLEDRPVPDVATAIRFDPAITESQKRALLQIYEAFRDESRRTPPAQDAVPMPRTPPVKPKKAIVPAGRAAKEVPGLPGPRTKRAGHGGRPENDKLGTIGAGLPKHRTTRITRTTSESRPARRRKEA